MTAGVLALKKATIARCGCCGAPNPIALCERCEEPMCARHLEALRTPGEIQFICTICREAIATGLLQATAGASA